MIPIAVLCRLSASPRRTEGRRLSFIVALRACAALNILWHHFALYPPLRDWAAPLIGDVLDWIEHHGRVTQVFFVISGFVMARSMSGHDWCLRRIGCFALQRYYRLGIPYLATIALILPVYAFARGWVPDDVLGSPVTLPQLLAHFFFPQDLLGYEPLSAGLWFVCINFQLSLVFAALLWLGDRLGGTIDTVGLLGWPLAILSLFYVNLDPAWKTGGSTSSHTSSSAWSFTAPSSENVPPWSSGRSRLSCSSPCFTNGAGASVSPWRWVSCCSPPRNWNSAPTGRATVS